MFASVSASSALCPCDPAVLLMVSEGVNMPRFEDEGGTVVVHVPCSGTPLRLHLTLQELKMSRLSQIAVIPETQ